MSNAKLTLNKATLLGQVPWSTVDSSDFTLTSNDCGTGSGGFKLGNRCAKGGIGSKSHTEYQKMSGLHGKLAKRHLSAAKKLRTKDASRASKHVEAAKHHKSLSKHYMEEATHAFGKSLFNNSENPMELLTSNFYGKTRRETLNGVDYVVVPLTMVVPGVLNGSRGPLLYPKSELKKDPMAWNNMPIVVNHPRNAFGMPISARQPNVLEKVGIGTVFNTQFKDKLRAEGWFDIDKTKRVAPEILEGILNRKPQELSTGLFTDNEQAEGVFNYANGKAKKYQYIARNHRPDHLAILTGEAGACSVEDGCGVGVENTKGNTMSEMNALLAKLTRNARTRAKYADVIELLENAGANCGIGPGGFRAGNKCAKGGGGGGKLTKLTGKGERRTAHIDRERPTHSKIAKTSGGHGVNLTGKGERKTLKKRKATSQKKKTYRVNLTGKGERMSIHLNSRDAKVLEKLLANDTLYQAKSMSHAFGNDKAMDEMGAKPMKKKHKKMMNGDHSGSPSCNLDSGEPDMAKLTDKQREQIVDSLITNACSCKNKGKCGCKDKGVFQEEDREGLEGMSDERLVQMNNALVENSRKVAVVNSLATDGVDVGKEHYVLNDDGTFVKAKKTGKKPSDPDEDEDEGEEGVSNNAEQNEDKWLKNAPPRIKGIVRNAMRLEDEQREQLIETITANSNNRYTEEQLTAMETDDLENLAALAGPAANSYEDEDEEVKPRRRPNYLGAGVPSGRRIAANAGESDDLLIPPTMNFEDEHAEDDGKATNRRNSLAASRN